MTADDDAALVARARRGDEAACEDLVRRFASPVLAIVTRIVRDPGVAEELTQETFIKVFRGLGSFDPGLRLAPWVLRIAHNTAIDHVRRVRPDFVPLSESDTPERGAVVVESTDRTPFDQAEHADLSRALEWALSQLRPDYRRLVVMRYQLDQSYEDIASALGLPLGTVKSNLHRARHTMAGLLEEAGWAPHGVGDA